MKKMKRILIVCLAMCMLCFCAVSCSVKDYFEQINSRFNGTENSEMNSSNKESLFYSDVGGEVSDFIEVDESDEILDLVPPDDIDSLCQDGLALTSAIGLDFNRCTKETGSICFTYKLDSFLANLVSKYEKYNICFLVAPLHYFDHVNTENYTYIDWISVFKRVDFDYQLFEISVPTIDINNYPDFYYGNCYLDISFEKYINQSFVGMPVMMLTNEDGTLSYRYASYEKGDYRTNARSLAYVAADSLNKYALGEESYTAEQIELLKTYVNWSVDQANGLTEPTDDDSTYTVSVSPTTLTLNVGETATINVDVAQDVDVPVVYKPLAESVVTVTDTGKITSVSVGTTVVTVYVAGVSYAVKITVT